MLSEVAETKPLLCVVDDAHWLDTASADALLFAARRLQADPVALIFAARDGDVRTFTADGVPELVLTGLAAPEARLLLAERGGAALSEQITAVLLEQTGGNPLALVELPRSLTVAQRDGTAPIPAQLRLTDRVQRVFLDRCRRLPVEVQTLLLVAAADDSENLAVVAHAAALLGVSAIALPEVERAGLLVTDRDTVRVRHPLVRSGVYQAATGHERRAVHRALADALTEDPDRRAWHRAAAVEGPDAEVAAALQVVAGRAERRSAYVAAAAAYERAAALTVDEPTRAGLLFAAARNAWASGRAGGARELADAAKAGADDRILRADIDRLRGRIEVNVGAAATAYRIFSGAARAVVDDDDARSVEMWVAATLTRMFDTDTSAGPAADPIPERATQARAGDVARTRCLRLLLAATIADTAGRWAPALRSLRAAVEASAEIEDPDVLANLGNAALHLGDDQSHRSCFKRMLGGARDLSAGMLVLYALPRLAFADLMSGYWSQVRSAAEEVSTLSADTGQSALGVAPLAWLTLLAALQGREDYDTLRTQLDVIVAQRHLGVLEDAVHDLSRWAAGVQAANDSDTSGSLRQLSQLRLPALSRMAAVARLEAAIRAGQPDRAHAWLDDLTEFSETTRWPWALAAAQHGRAVLADPADAADLFENALTHP